MQVKSSYTTDTEVKLSVNANFDELSSIKNQVLSTLGDKHANIPGFRSGKAPLGLIEKNINPELLQSEFIDSAVNQLYAQAIESEKLRPIDQPKIQIDKFVPFSTLEFSATINVIGKIKLADYKKIKMAKNPVKVSEKEVKEVIESLRKQAADKTEIKTAAKNGDQVTIDFTGVDTKTNQSINGADGKDYPLTLGSDAFIPGFEAELIGLKAGEKKTFTITFPKDYGVTTLQNRQVQFSVTVSKVEALSEPTVDDKFAKKVGPFDSLSELKADIKKQLKSEGETRAARDYQNALITKITELSELSLPQALIEEQLDRTETEEKQNLAYKGQTWNEHLVEEGVSEEEHRLKNRPGAELTLKASLVLGEIADQEKVTLTPEELEIRIQILKAQYQDKKMQAELDNPDNRQSLANQLMAEKTFKILTDYATKN
jgi:trigger factor